MKSARIPIKVGSHSTTIFLSNQDTKCDTFVKMCLIQCGVIKNVNAIENFKHYSLFERLNGVEVIIDANENVFNLWTLKWEKNKKIELVVKKFQKSKKLTRIIEKNQRRLRRETDLRNERVFRISKYFKSMSKKNAKLKLRIKCALTEHDTIRYANNHYEILNHHYEEIKVNKSENGLFAKFKKIILKKF